MHRSKQRARTGLFDHLWRGGVAGPPGITDYRLLHEAPLRYPTTGIADCCARAAIGAPSRPHRQPIVVIVRPTVLDRHVPILDIADLVSTPVFPGG
jgi:hypothetical protein